MSKTSPNGIRLCHFAEERNLRIKSTYFAHKNIHKGTWRIPDSRGSNQIDHVLIDSRHFSNITDVKACRGANCDSDHYLVRVKVWQRISNVARSKGIKREKWDTDKLRDDRIKEQFQEAIRNKLQINNDTEGDDNVETVWNNIKNAVTESTKECLGQKQIKRNEEWFDHVCRSAIEIKNTARLLMLQKKTRSSIKTYKEKRRDANKICRKKKRENMKKKMSEIELHRRHNNNIRDFYKCVKRISTGYQPRLAACKDERGVIISEDSKVIDRWKQYFEKLLNVQRNDNIVETEIERNRQIDSCMPDMRDVEDALLKLKNNKAPGENGLTAELYKYGGKHLIKWLHILISKIWQSKKMPYEWRTSLIFPIYKKGDKLVCSNYRGIALLDTAYKVLSNIIFKKLNKVAEERIDEYQAGFRNGRSINDHIFIVKRERNIT